MCARYTLALMFVFGFSLVCWGDEPLRAVLAWKLDEDANDASDNSHHGTLEGFSGGGNWVPGVSGSALHFDGVDDRVINTDGGLSTDLPWISEFGDGQRQADATMNFWIKADHDDNPVDYCGIAGWGKYNGGVESKWISSKSGGRLFWYGPNFTSGPIASDTWQMITVVIDQLEPADPSHHNVYVYIDGVLDSYQGGVSLSRGSEISVELGHFPKYSYGSHHWKGTLDEFTIWQGTLSQQQINILYQNPGLIDFGSIGPYAWNPSPEDNAGCIDTDIELTWNPGLGADSHDVYFGESFVDVNEADGPETGDIDDSGQVDVADIWEIAQNWMADDSNSDLNNDGIVNLSDFALLAENWKKTNTYKANQPVDSNSYDPGILELDKTYYWRVDERDGATVHKGNTWKFTAELDRGHKLLIKRGLQIQGIVWPLTTNSFDLDRWEQSNFTTVNLWHGHSDMAKLGSPPGLPWSRLNMVSDNDLPYLSNLVSLQLGDEQPLSNPSTRQNIADKLADWRAEYPNVIVYANQLMGEPASNVSLLMEQAKPDMIMRGVYVFTVNSNNERLAPNLTVLYHYLMLQRNLGVLGNDGTGQRPTPYAYYQQTFEHCQGERFGPPSESEARLSQFAAWAMGYKFITGFIYNTPYSTDDKSPAVSASCFHQEGEKDPSPLFYQLAESNRQSRNIGETLVRLLSTDVRMISNQYSVPSNMQAWDPWADPYITSINPINLGSVNGGNPSDVLVGYFKPLDESFDGYEYQDQLYFMIVNGLTGKHALASETQQQINITFDFGGSGINSLQRLNRDTGQVEVVPLIHLGGSMYKLELVLPGGTGDLFKFNTGAPFINGPFDSCKAANPAPDNYNRFVAGGTSLTWEPADNADSHNVYFGTSYNDVNDANTGSSEFKGNQTETTYSTTLDANSRYYWRIDEVLGDKTCNGNVWTFKTLPYRACLPIPSDGATLVKTDALLSWLPGFDATSNDVYFGNTYPPAFRGNQTGSYFNPGTLERGTTYYWRIDEYGPSGKTTGNLWTFKTKGKLPDGPTIDSSDITATASSMYGDKRHPQNVVSGLGIYDSDELLHSDALDTMWMNSWGHDAGSTPGGLSCHVWIQFEFDKIYSLDKIWVWNHNQAGLSNRGLRNVTIEYSTNASNWSTLGQYEFAEALGTPYYEHNTEIDFGGVQAKYVVISAPSLSQNGNWGNDHGGYGCFGLSEILFFGE